MSRSMQNLLREFRTLYEERLQRLDLATPTPENMKAKNDVYQHYVHDLLEQNDALINSLKDSENKLETSGQLETSLMEEVNLAKGFEEELGKVREAKLRLEDEVRTIEDQSHRLREQLDESDLARERLEAIIAESHNDLARARIEMNDLRDKIRKYETNSDGIDQQVIRLKVQLEEEQGETERVTNINCDYQRNIDRLKTELAASHLKNRKLDAELSEREIEMANLEKELLESKMGASDVQSKENQDKQKQIVLAAKVSELEKELRPLRLENDTTVEKLSREKELSMELASTVSRLKDQVQIQVENFSKIELSNKELKRKNKESQEEIQSLDRRRSTLINETQKLRELLNEAQTDRQSLKESSRKAEAESQKLQSELRNENRQLEVKLERRAQEIDELVTKITKLNNNIGSLKSAGSSAKDENRELENRLIELNREMTSFGSLSEDQKDKIAELGHTLHQRDVEIDGLRSSFTNKAAESEELMSQLSKQEQLVHELTTELNTKNSELKRLTLTHEDIIKELDENIELARIQKVKIESQDEVIGSLKAEVDEYEKMKPHPESEVNALKSKIDFLNLEKESLNVKKVELERRSTELSSLCNELRKKLKCTVATRDQTAHSATLIETKLHQAEMRIKELDSIIENIKHQSDQKCEKLNSKIEILHSRVAEAENYKRNSDQLCQNAQVHSQELRSETDRLQHELSDRAERISKLDRDAQLSSKELEQLSDRLKDKHIENCKLEKLVEELTNNCENLQRHKRESESLLKALRGEIGMASKARKVTEKQIENYRVTVRTNEKRQLEETATTRNIQNERLNDQIAHAESTEHHLRSKKKELKTNLAEFNELNAQLKSENSDIKRENTDLTRRAKSLEDALKSLRREVDVIRQKTKRENDHIRKNKDLSDAEFVRKNNELEAKNLRLQGECMRLGDVIEKTQSELNTSKIQLSQIHRQEAQSRQELDSIRSLTNNKDKRGKELQIEIDRLQCELSRVTSDLHRQMREKENLMSGEEKLRKYSMKQQTLIQELRRKLAMFNSDLKQDFKKVSYQPHQLGAFGDFASTQ